MATLLENERLHTATVDKAAELHNAQIKERYRRLQDAEADQFAEETVTETNVTDYSVRAFVATPVAPVQEQVPQVTEFVRERIDSPVFTTEKFERLQATETKTIAHTAPLEFPVQTVAPAAVSNQETQYSLSRLAKTVMAAFAALVVLMLTLICVNTNLISQKAAYLRSLETQRQELVELHADIQARIQQATSDEAIEEYAKSQGMIRGEE